VTETERDLIYSLSLIGFLIVESEPVVSKGISVSPTRERHIVV
jgi:hypothetical protein